VIIGKQKFTINAGVYTISGYSAHADQQNLLNFVKRMRKKPREIRLVHGDPKAKSTLKERIKSDFPHLKVVQNVAARK
jgi:metallo-beta-lactamase family protein